MDELGEDGNAVVGVMVVMRRKEMKVGVNVVERVEREGETKFALMVCSDQKEKGRVDSRNSGGDSGGGSGEGKRRKS